MNRGAEAEKYAAEYLEKLGFKILNQNWRNRYCEIDIVAKRNNVIHFVEVKYRASNTAGSAIDYVTPAKLKQMKLAAQHWVYESEWSGEYQLDVIAIDGAIALNRIRYLQSVYEN